jgi:chromosome segregation ATPase
MTEEKEKKERQEEKTINMQALEALTAKLDQTIERISTLEDKIDRMNPELQDATGSLNMTLAILRTFQEVTNVATIFSPSKWLMRLRPDVNLDAIERVIVDVLT